MDEIICFSCPIISPPLVRVAMNVFTHRKSPSRQGRERALHYSWYHLVSINLPGELILMWRNNGRSRGSCSFQTYRRPSAHLLRGKLPASLVLPLLRSMRLLLPLIVTCIVLF